jgi:hypothetical protein
MRKAWNENSNVCVFAQFHFQIQTVCWVLTSSINNSWNNLNLLKDFHLPSFYPRTRLAFYFVSSPVRDKGGISSCSFQLCPVVPIKEWVCLIINQVSNTSWLHYDVLLFTFNFSISPFSPVPHMTIHCHHFLAWAKRLKIKIG